MCCPSRGQRIIFALPTPACINDDDSAIFVIVTCAEWSRPGSYVYRYGEGGAEERAGSIYLRRGGRIWSDVLRTLDRVVGVRLW